MTVSRKMGGTSCKIYSSPGSVSTGYLFYIICKINYMIYKKANHVTFDNNVIHVAKA